jgi:cytochrome c-type biogenesis protein CcmF
MPHRRRVVLGDVLLLGALALAGAALASGAFHLLMGHAPAGKRAGLLAMAAAALCALSFLVLAGHFAAHDYGIYYVWNYSDEATPLWLRLAGTWAGSAGSIFLWTLLIGAAIAAEEVWQRRAAAKGLLAPGKLEAIARLVALAVFVVFLLFTIQARPFAPTADFHFDGDAGFFTYQPGKRHLPDPLDFRAEGFGLNPLLQTPFMAIHPPMEFLAYAATTLPFAYALAHLVTRDPRWVGAAIQWGRIAWAFYATALGLGALWAYYVLSFGGYWAWDPVEVGDLIPFLGLTVFLHAADMHRKGKGYHHYAPFLAAIAFPLTLFGTFVTRSSYWISAHAFDVGTASIVADPAQRLVAIVGAKEQVADVAALLLVVLGAIAALYVGRYAIARWRERRVALGLPALVVLGAYAAAMALAAWDVQGLLAQGFGLAAFLGGGDVLLGLALLGLALVGLPVALMVWSLPDDEEAKDFDPAALAEPDALMSAGVVLLSLGLLVTFALLVVGVNFTVTQLGDAFRARLPLVVLPLTLVMTMRLTVKHLGKGQAALLGLGSGALGLLLWLALPAPLKLLGLGVPVFSVALGGGILQLLKAAGKGSTAGPESKRAGMLMLLASLTGFAMWASPPSVLALGSLVVPVPLALVPVGLAASIAAYVLGVATLNGEGPRAALLGGIASVLTVGYGLGFLLGLAAMALGHRARGSMSGRPLRKGLAHVKGRLYGTSRWAAHVAILLVFIGYGASAYHAEEADYRDLSDPLERGVPRAFAGHTLTLLDSEGVDQDRDGGFERVTAWVEVRRGGVVLEVAPIAFYWVDKESQYRPTEHVVRQPLEDLYLNSDPGNLPAMRTADGNWTVSNQRALFDATGEVKQMRSDQVEALSLSVKRLPMVAPLWAGAAMLPFTMVVALLAAPPRGFAKAAGRPGAAPPADAAAASPPRGG